MPAQSCAGEKAPGESGMALLMVMGVLSACMLLIAHIMLVSGLVSRESYAVATKGLLRYQAESAAETAFWLHLTDRRLYSNRTLGQSENDALRENSSFPEPWMLDGRPHVFDDGNAYVYLQSAENGIKLNSLEADLKKGLDLADDANLIAAIDELLDAYKDYVDADDLLNLNGFEKDDYANAGFPTLPRNAAMQFKHEVYWLPNWDFVIQEQICIIPPAGIKYEFAKSNKPSLFASSDASICLRLDIEPDSAELDEIHSAIQKWQEDGTALEDSLDIDLYSKIKQEFDFTEPGLALVSAQAYDPNREIHAGYRVIREAKIGSRTIFADSQKECFSIWERIWE